MAGGTSTTGVEVDPHSCLQSQKKARLEEERLYQRNKVNAQLISRPLYFRIGTQPNKGSQMRILAPG